LSRDGSLTPRDLFGKLDVLAALLNKQADEHDR
jgi:hypothetical protein